MLKVRNVFVTVRAGFSNVNLTDRFSFSKVTVQTKTRGSFQ